MNETYMTILFGDALIGLQDAVKKLSLNDLTQEYSRFCDGAVIVTNGPTEESCVYRNGLIIGYANKDGTINRFDDNFWSDDAGLDENTKADLIKSANNDELVPIVDEHKGGIIGYAIRGNEDKFVSALQQFDGVI